MDYVNNSSIVYLAHGSKKIYNQVLFSLLTLHYHLNDKNIQIIIYTDNPTFFSAYLLAFNLKLEILTPDKFKEYIGDYKFIHRAKICILKDCFEKYNTNILYLDSDTYFNESPVNLLIKISITTSIMNSDDYDLMFADELFENMDWLQIRRAIRNFDYNIDGNKLQIPLTTRMWNAGVIGIAKENKHLLKKVLELTDQIYRNKGVFTAEQFAFSYFLQNYTQLIPTGKTITHYWPNHKGMYWKNQYDEQIAQLLDKIKSKSIIQKSEAAYNLTKQHNQIIMNRNKTFSKRLLDRFSLLWKVARTGKVEK